MAAAQEGGSCSPAPRTGCLQSDEVELRVSRSPERINWRWHGAAPSTDGDFGLCLYDGERTAQTEAAAPARRRGDESSTLPGTGRGPREHWSRRPAAPHRGRWRHRTQETPEAGPRSKPRAAAVDTPTARGVVLIEALAVTPRGSDREGTRGTVGAMGHSTMSCGLRPG